MDFVIGDKVVPIINGVYQHPPEDPRPILSKDFHNGQWYYELDGINTNTRFSSDQLQRPSDDARPAVGPMPGELLPHKNWVCWRLDPARKKGDKPVKVPIDPKSGNLASSTDPATWGTHRQAVEAVDRHKLAGIGFVFTNTPFCGIDLDHCIDPETGGIEPWAVEIVKALDSYTEFSPSGTGLHVIVKGDKPGSNCRKDKVEIYDTGRYFTMTGNAWAEMPGDIQERQAELDALYHELFSDLAPAPAVKAQRPGNNGRLDDAALLDRMFTSKSGPKIQALWDGDISGYASHSEADQALCNYLAFWTDRDPAAIDRLFRGSGLYRPDKWGDRSDYRDRTIGAAIAATSEGYHPSPAARGNFIPETLTPREAESWGETGDARLLAEEYRGRLIYDHAAGQWLAWAGHWWEPDRCGASVKHVSNDIAALYLAEAAAARKADDQKTSEALQKRARQLRDRRRCENVLFLAARPYLGIVGDEWDRDPWALGCVNGVLDLKTGTLRPGRPADYIQAHCPTEWAGLDAPAPIWEQCISDVLGGDRELIAFTQRLLGYAVAGLTTEHIFPILWGDGRNGKSTILETLKSVLGDTLAMRTEADALMITGRDVAGDAPKPYLFAMRGKRLCWASESREGRRLDVNLIKTLAGGDTMNVRTLHGRPVSWEPTHTLFLLTNNRPQISPDDRAIWDRVLLIPFTQRFVDDPGPGELQRDPDIKQKLLSEASGILAWLVRGCLEWQRGGLRPPQTVKTETEEYRREEDTVQQFLDDRCVTTGPGAAVCTTRAGELYAAYKQWGQSSGLEVISSTSFGRRLGKLGYTKDKKPTGLVYQGIGLLP